MTLSRAITCRHLARGLSLRQCTPIACLHRVSRSKARGPEETFGHERVPTLRPPSHFLRWISSVSGDGSSWELLGLHTALVLKLQDRYPHISEPTDAQKALLLALSRSDRRDLLLRDAMGRGKTFVMALAALRLAQNGERVMILIPSIQLAEQVSSLLLALSADSLDFGQTVLVTTPQAALKDDSLLQRYSTIMIDEPETMLAPLPPRHLPPPATKSHPFHRHPPPLALLLDGVLLSHDERPRTVWVGAELNGLLKRIIRQRGWASREALELDFGNGSTPRAKADVLKVLGLQPAVVHSSPSVAHVGLLVDHQTGNVRQLQMSVGSKGTVLPPPRSGRPEIDQAIIDALVSYELRSSLDELLPSALILPPEGYPLDHLAVRINETLATQSSDTSTCSVFDPQTQSADNRMTVISRSAVSGLDIPTLRRIYLIDGLDLAGLSPAHRARGGLKRRLGFYDIVTGRLGRMGSVTADSGGEVISLAVRGSGEEVGLNHILLTSSPNGHRT